MAIDDTVKIINLLRFIVSLRGVEGNVSIKDGIMTFEDGIHELLAGRLPIDIITPTDMKKALRMVRDTVRKEFAGYELVNSDPYHYYSLDGKANDLLYSYSEKRIYI